jgi:predicted kinase
MKKRNDQKCHILRGLPASGKSTWAKKEAEQQKNLGNETIIINNDSIRIELNQGKEVPWTPKFEKKVRALRFERMERALKGGFDIIVDNTHLNYKTLNSLKTWLKQNFPHVIIVEKSFLDVSIQECIDRDKAREERGEPFVGTEVIMKMVNDANLMPEIPPYPIDWSLPWTIICDLDGSLALFGKKRNPYDCSQCDLTDEPNLHVLNLLRTYQSCYNTNPDLCSPYVSEIHFFTGRTDNYKEPTLRFLLKKCGFDVANDPFFELVMRTTGDSRPDEIVKEEMFDYHIRGKYNVFVIIDDRLRVCRKWRSMGLPLFQVGSGEEF